MLINYFRTAIRNLLRYKIFTAINIIGLAIGMAGALLIMMYVANETSYENFHKNRENIVRVAASFGDSDNRMWFAGAMGGLGPAAVENVPEVIQSVRLQQQSKRNIKLGDQIYNESVFFAENTLLNIFTLPLIQGDIQKALTEPNTVILTRSKAEKYFGSDDPMGQTLILDDQYPLKVTGVMEDIPKNTHLNCQIVVSYPTLVVMETAHLDSWDVIGDTYTYLELAPGASREALYEKLVALKNARCNNYFSGICDLKIQELTDIHMDSNIRGDLGPKGNPTYVTLFSSIAILVLLIACFNFMNLSTARSSLRIREVGMRKVLGARRLQLIRQFLTESILMASLAVLIGLGLFELTFSSFNRFMEFTLVIGKGFNYLALFVPALILVVGVFAGAYPAFILSRFRPVTALQKITDKPGKASLRKILVVVQFALSILLIINTLVIGRQLHYMKNANPGFDKHNVAVIRFYGARDAKARYDLIRDQLNSHAAIHSVSGAYSLPGTTNEEKKTIGLPGADESHIIQAIAVDYDYAPALGLNILEGRNFSPSQSTDAQGSILLNEKAVAMLGLTDPVGKTVVAAMSGGRREMRVIGVLNDFHIQSLKEDVKPMMLYIYPKMFYMMAVRLNEGQEEAGLAHIRETWSRLVENKPLDMIYLTDAYNNLYVSEEKTSLLFSIFSGLAIFIACMGLFGLAAFTAERKSKEIGIRKVMGATAIQMVSMLLKEYVRWVLIANIIAWPIAWLLMNRWLHQYVHRIPLSLWIFTLAGAIALFIALATVSMQALKAAMTNPADTIRYE